MEEQKIAEKKPSDKKAQLIGSLFFLVVIVVIIVIIVSVVNANNANAAKYTVDPITSSDIVPVNASEVAISIHVTNIGKSAGTPTCTIDPHDAQLNNTGSDVVTLKGSIKPGATNTFVDDIKVTTNGATSITTADVSCN